MHYKTILEQLKEKSGKGSYKKNGMGLTSFEDNVEFFVGGGSNDADLSDYYTKTEVDNELSELETTLAQLVDDKISGLPTDNFLKNAEYISEDKKLVLTMVSGIVVEVDLEDLVDVYDDEPIWDAVGLINNILDDVYRKEEVDNLINDAIDAIEFPETDLSDYYKKDETYSQDEVNTKLDDKVSWVSTSNEEKDKCIVLDNHQNLLGRTTSDPAENGQTGYGNGTYNLAMVSKWNVADYGSEKLLINFSGKGDRPTYNDTKEIALLEDIDNKQNTLTAGDNINITEEGVISADNTTYDISSLESLNSGEDNTGMLHSPSTLNEWLDKKGYLTEEDVENTEYSAGAGLDLIDVTFSVKLDMMGEQGAGGDNVFVKSVELGEESIEVTYGTVDLSNLVTEEYVDSAVGGIEIPEVDLTDYYIKDETYSQDEVDTLLGDKVKSDDVYLKDEIDTIINNLPADKFLSAASYDTETHILSLTIENNDVIDVNLEDLVDVYDDTEIKDAIDVINNKLNDVYSKDEVDTELDNKVSWVSTSNEEKDKCIVLDNHQNLLGRTTSDPAENGQTGYGNSTYNLAMVSKWNVADYGSEQLLINFSGKGDRPTYNDTKEIALLEDIDNKQDKITGVADIVVVTELPQSPKPNVLYLLVVEG